MWLLKNLSSPTYAVAMSLYQIIHHLLFDSCFQIITLGCPNITCDRFNLLVVCHIFDWFVYRSSTRLNLLVHPWGWQQGWCCSLRQTRQNGAKHLCVHWSCRGLEGTSPSSYMATPSSSFMCSLVLHPYFPSFVLWPQNRVVVSASAPFFLWR